MGKVPDSKHKDVSLDAQNPPNGNYNGICLCPRAVVQRVEKRALKFIVSQPS